MVLNHRLSSKQMASKAEKHARNAESYTSAYKKAFKHTKNGMITYPQEMNRLLKTVIDGRRKSSGETVFFWHQASKQVGWLTNDEMREQAKIWKKAMKSGVKIEFLEHNCQTKLINGEEWHILVCGNEDTPIDPLGAGIDDGIFMVSGLIYWFKHKASRDTIFTYLTK
jgi:hypothetical protein